MSTTVRLNHFVGAEANVGALSRCARAVIDLKPVAALGDDERAIIIYQVTTGPFGTLTCGERITVRDANIQTDLVAFDTFKTAPSRALASQPREAAGHDRDPASVGLRSAYH